MKQYNPNLSQISDHPYKIFLIGSSVSGKTNTLLNLISYHQDMDKIYLRTKGHIQQNINY